MTVLKTDISLAALSVVYSHSQIHFKETLPYNTYNLIGYDGVRCFFVLSAFLLTFRGILEWETYLEKRDTLKDKKPGNIEHQNVNNNDNVDDEENTASNLSITLHLDNGVNNDNEKYNETTRELDSNIKLVSKRKGIFSKLYEDDNLTAIKIWTKFFLRRFMRVYPPYAILLISIAYNQFLGESFFHYITPDNLIPHLVLKEAQFNFWSIPPEMQINGYNEKKGGLIGRVIAFSIILFARTVIAFTLDNRNPLWLEGTAHYFLGGSLSSKILGYEYDLKVLRLETNAGGLLYTALILLGLLSRNESFVELLSWNYFCFCGKISFSIYLLHPIAFNLVNNYFNEYLTFIGNVETLKDVDQSDQIEKNNDMFDSVMLSYLVTIILSWFYHKLVESPFMNLANAIARKWLK
ncbi:6285_t:CDS:2 [Entrophospora sp. SA101]|nr:6285_t:CDS:2 [Entrophospora sp. SA101]